VPLVTALLGALVVATVPGVLVAYLLRMSLRTLLTWALVPALSLATIFLLGELTAAIRVPFGVPAFLLLILALGGAAVAARLRGRTARQSDLIDRASQPPGESRAVERIAYGLLVLGVLAGVFVWWHGLRGAPLVLPGGDGARHGFLVARIVHGESIDVSQVMVSDADGARQVSDYFPLAGHASAAVVTRLTPADVGEVLVALTVVFAAVVLPVGMFVLARVLVPDRPLVAGITALTVPALTLFPYSPTAGGQVFSIVGMAMVPAAVVFVVRSLHTGNSSRGSPAQAARALAPAALVLVAVTSTHSSELAMVVLLAWLLVLERAWLERQLHVISTALGRSLRIAVLMLLLFLPTLGAVVSGALERSGTTALGVSPGDDWTELLGPTLTLRTHHFTPGGFAAALPHLPTMRQTVLAGLAFVGAVIFVRYRKPAWVIGWMAVIVLSLFASTSSNLVIRTLTFPWYRGSVRLNWNQAFFVPVLAAVPIALVIGAIARVLRGRRSAIVPATVSVVALFVALVAVPGYRTSWAFLRSTFTVKVGTIGNQARVDGSSEAAFQWLESHADASDTVVNDPVADSSLWMYALYGVKPLIGWAPPTRNLSDYRNRRYVVQHVNRLGEDVRVEQLLQKYRARWIYFDERRFPLQRHALKLEALRRHPRIDEVFHRNGVSIFKIKAV
jgi:D-galactosaminyltransferase